MNSPPAATVAFVPRETVSQTIGCLDRLIEKTSSPHDLVAVVAGYPAEVTAQVRDRVELAGGRLIEFSSFVTPNEARNAALAAARTRYIVFVDHDVYVADGWLEPLLECARETGAAIVSPLIFEGEPMFTRLHMAGGEARVIPLSSGCNDMRDLHHEAHERFADISEPLRRKQTELIEFHTALVETDWLRAAGGLDPELRSLAEHWDMCIQAARDGRSIYLEPRSHVNYSPPSRLMPEDVRWFNLRWSDDWSNRSIGRLVEKYDIAPDVPAIADMRNFLKSHRRHRFAPARKRIGSVLGKRAGRYIAFKIIKPLVDLRERSTLRRDLAAWQQQRIAYEAATAARPDQSSSI